MVAATEAIDRLGSVGVIRQADLHVELQMNEPYRRLELKLQLLDCGQMIGTENYQCDVKTHAAIYRVPVKEVQTARRQAVDLFTSHYENRGNTSSDMKPSIWQTVAVLQAMDGVPKHVTKLEKQVVSAVRERSQPNRPYWSSMMLAPYAEGKAELKIFFDASNKIKFKLMIPISYFEGDYHCGSADDNDFPVVVKAYAKQHAYAARMISLSVDGVSKNCSEDVHSVDSQRWGGLHVRDLLAVRHSILQHGIQFEVRVALTMTQLLQRQRFAVPEFVYQDGFAMQCGGVTEETVPTKTELLKWTVPDKASATGETPMEFLRRVDYAYSSVKHGKCPCILLEKLATPQDEPQRMKVQFWCTTKTVEASQLLPLKNSNLRFQLESQTTMDKEIVGGSAAEQQSTENIDPLSQEYGLIPFNMEMAREKTRRMMLRRIADIDDPRVGFNVEDEKIIDYTSEAEEEEELIVLSTHNTVDLDTVGGTANDTDGATEDDQSTILDGIPDLGRSPRPDTFAEWAEEFQAEAESPREDLSEEEVAAGNWEWMTLSDLIRTDEEQERLRQLHDEYKDMSWVDRECEIPQGTDKPSAMRLLVRAVEATISHREEAYNKEQSSLHPGRGWLNQHGLLMEEVVKWTEVAFSDQPADKRICLLEELIREIEHMGHLAPHLQASNVNDFFADLPQDLKTELMQMMTEGVHVGVERSRLTQHASPSRTAIENSDKVWTQLTKFAALGYVRVFPPSVWKILKRWKLIISPVHFVPSTKYKKNDRLVMNGSQPDDMQEEEGQDLNNLSPDMGYDDVQADYIDEMIKELTEALLIEGCFNEEELSQFQADIKSAFKTVAVSVDSMGCICVEFEGWVFVYNRVAFGWKWATHVWSIFAKAIKLKVRSYERNGWKCRDSSRDWRRMARRTSRLTELRNDKEDDLAEHLAKSWRMNITFMYIDDLYSLLRSFNDIKAARLADSVRTVGFLLLGPSAWSLSKAEEESFFSKMQKHTGVLMHTSFGPQPRASFAKDRILRCLEIVNEVLEDTSITEWSLHFFMKAWGNFVWLQKVYRSFKPFTAAFRRPLQGHPTVSAKEAQLIKVSPKQPNEGVAKGAEKFRRDMRVIQLMLEYLRDIKEEYGEDAIETTVPFLCMAGIEDWDRLPPDSWTSIGGDASGTGWSVLEHSMREILIMPIPQVLSDVLRKRAKLEPMDTRELFMVAIAEHLVLVFAMLQWGASWKASGIQLVKYWTDNQNSHAWVKSMFANNALAQDLCRLIAVLALRYDLHVVPMWLSTHDNFLADLASRVYTDAKTRCDKEYPEWVRENARLDDPYQEVDQVEPGRQLTDLIAETKDPFTLSEQLLLRMEEFLEQCLKKEPSGHQLHRSQDEDEQGARLPRSLTMREELEQYRESWTIQDAKAWSRNTTKAYSVGLIGGAAQVASMGVTRAGGKILFCSEIDPIKQLLAEDLTGGAALGDLWKLDWDRIPRALIWLLTLPCINHARSGDRTGRHGIHGVLFVQAAYVIMHCLPLIFVSEISDYAEFVNDGEDIQMVMDITSPKYVVHKVRLSMAAHGDPSHRKRLALVGLLRTFSGAHDWKPPQGEYGDHHPHCARDTADADEDVLEEDKRTETLHTTYLNVPKPPFGQMQKLGRLKPGFAMGPGYNPNLFLGLDGLRNGPTTHGGGGTFPPQNWRQNETLPWRKVTSITEHYRTASLSLTVKDWHESFLPDQSSAEQKRTLRAWVADGFHVHTVDNIMRSLFQLMDEHNIAKDMPRTHQLPDEYVTEARWLPTDTDSVGGLGDGGHPTEAAVRKFMTASDRDWSEPLYPSQPGRRHHLTGPLSDMEWAQMQYGLDFAEFMQLRETSWAAYNLQCLKILEFFQRYPVAETFSEEHASTGLLMQAVWKDTEVEKMLINLIMHEAFVRGNGWSSCRQMLYAFRHINVRKLHRDPLKFKPRLWQLMDGIKKGKGTKKPKHPVCRAMLLVLEKLLNHEESLEDLKLWASILLAFHFMLRSMDYCAKRAGGKFDFDNVLRISDIIFLKNGVRLHAAFETADEITIILGRGKTTEGGETRTHVRSREARLCVVRTMGRMFDRMDRSQEHEPVFAWPENTRRPGDGVRYCDVMQLLKQAAEECGKDPNSYGTHSCRRGGASAYVLAGASVEEVAIFGRWKDSRSVRLYVEPAAHGLLVGMEDKVNEGCRDKQLLLRRPARERHDQIMRAIMRAGAHMR